MAFNHGTKRGIVRDRKTGEHLPCVMCGSRYPLPEAVHIIDAKEWLKKHGHDGKVNGMPLCPNCHKVFDEILRPYLYKALESFGTKGLPLCWKKSNKITVTENALPIEDNT